MRVLSRFFFTTMDILIKKGTISFCTGGDSGGIFHPEVEINDDEICLTTPHVTPDFHSSAAPSQIIWR